MITNPIMKQLILCDGVTTKFPITMTHYGDDLLIKHRDVDTKFIVELEKDVDWEYFEDTSGAYIITAVAYDINDVLMVNTDSPYTQEMDLLINDPLPPNSLEGALDKLTILSRQTNVSITGSIVLPEMLYGTYELPLPADRANKVLAFDAEGNPVPAASVPEGSVLFSPFGEKLVGSSTAEVARFLLDTYSTSEVYNKTEVYNKDEVYRKSETYTQVQIDDNINVAFDDLAGQGRTTETVKSNADAIANSFGYPIGFVYIQFPGQPSPIDMNLKGWWEWEPLTNLFAGLFFRAEGGNANPFETDNQGDQIQTFSGYAAGNGVYAEGNQFDKFGGVIESYTYSSGEKIPLDRVTGYNDPITGFAIDLSKGGVRHGSETRPVNATIRLWQRTA